MKIRRQTSLIRKILHGVVFLAVFVSVFGMGGSLPAEAQSAAAVAANHILSDGQFVYGPNIGDFVLKTYFEANAPHLSGHADGLYGRAEYFSINPKIYLTLLEIHSHLISTPEPGLFENPFGLNDGDFFSQVEELSSVMSEAYYLHLYSHSSLPASQRSLPPFVTTGGVTIHIAPETNAGTYAVIAGLAAMDEQNIPLLLDNDQADGFYQTYIRLFGDDPLDESNHIYIPGEVGALAAPANLLQLPYLRGLSWRFGGVHDTGGCSGLGGTALNNCQFTDASSLDFYPSGSTWNIDTSNMWVVAAASGIPTRYSDCGYKVSHSGALNTGWETTYYHLEGAKYLSGFVNQNDKIGVIANTLAEATCTGGAASGPHVHFSLKYNGAFVAINGTPLSGWYVHAGRWSYDMDSAYMWLERGGVKKYPSYPYYHVVLSEAPPPPPTVTISGNVGLEGVTLDYTDVTAKTATSLADGSYSFPVSANWSGTVTPTHPCYTFSPTNRVFASIMADQTQNFTPSAPNAACAPIDISIAGNLKGNYNVPPGGSISRVYPGMVTGPVHVVSTDGTPFFASERTIYNGGFSETMGYPNADLATDYWFTWYDHLYKQTYIMVSNPNAVGTPNANVDIFIGGGASRGNYSIPPGQSISKTYADVIGGPVHVVSNNAVKILASERTIYNGYFNETAGVPTSKLTTNYWFTWYDRVNVKTWLNITNPNAGGADAAVDVYVAGAFKAHYDVPPNSAVSKTYELVNTGPIEVRSTNGVKILSSQQAIYNGGYDEVIGYPSGDFKTEYWFPWYDRVNMRTWVMVSNPNAVGTADASVDIYIGGTKKETISVSPNRSVTRFYDGVVGGPVKVKSTNAVTIIASERTILNGIFNETMGVPTEKLVSDYWFTWYDRVYMSTWIMVGLP